MRERREEGVAGVTGVQELQNGLEVDLGVLGGK
jgi:hypothetical protein